MARVYRDCGTAAYSELQRAEFATEADGYTATRHQREVGTGILDHVLLAITGGASSTAAMGCGYGMICNGHRRKKPAFGCTCTGI